ncbi:hypothetical protein C9J01_14485 [Photobacterium rosenbergii]|uniref:Uncharacterized protein n=2 Tax=Photobacterium rosenbergii TaxID=294936 RepID=A0A2T3NDW5_9GAMM|nr:hypothetical protein C9J01_14485 [Photobacterium rosenbergii]
MGENGNCLSDVVISSSGQVNSSVDLLIKMSERLSSDIDLIWGVFLTITFTLLGYAYQNKGDKFLLKGIKVTFFLVYVLICSFLMLKYNSVSLIHNKLNGLVNDDMRIIMTDVLSTSANRFFVLLIFIFALFVVNRVINYFSNMQLINDDGATTSRY